MMYDDAGSNWGHRDNILDRHHTHVSIGIAYDNYTFVTVQNFENNYIQFTSPININTENENIVLQGTVPEGDKISSIAIYYDEPPTNSVYEKYKDQGYYELGQKKVAGVAPQGSYYQGIKTISALSWSQNDNQIDIRFSLAPVATEDGVYTILVWLEDKGSDSFTALAHSVFVEGP